MDIMVTPDTDVSDSWKLTDLLGRSMGNVSGTSGGYAISPEGNAAETMAGMKFGPFASLDEALAAIERHTRGVCRRT